MAHEKAPRQAPKKAIKGASKKPPAEKASSQAPQQALVPLPKRVVPKHLPKLDDIPRPPVPTDLSLFSTVAFLHERRHDRIVACQHERRVVREDILTARFHEKFPEIVERHNAAVREYREHCRRETRERTHAAREERRLARVRRRRARPKPLAKMTRTELWDKVEELLERGMPWARRGTMKTVFTPQDKAQVCALLEALGPYLGEEWRRMCAGPLQYVEGIPRNVVRVDGKTRGRANLVAMLIPKTVSATAIPACLQCMVKKLPCSYQKRIGRRRPTERTCQRCRRNGERCLVKKPKSPDIPRYWRFRDAQAVETEERQEAVAMWWEKRFGTIKALPMWHRNDADENRRDLDYRDKGWWNFLNDPTVEW